MYKTTNTLVFCYDTKCLQSQISLYTAFYNTPVQSSFTENQINV